MADILKIGSSALQSLQQAISTTGHNIANVNTEGYNRQRVNFATLPVSLDGGGRFVGNGVTTTSVQRFYDEYLSASLRTHTSSQAQFETFHELSTRLDGLLADPAVGLTPALESFFGAVQDVSNNPGSLPVRQALMGEAEVLADRFQVLDASFRTLENELNSRIDSTVSDINGLAQGIAELNTQIVETTGRSGGQVPNDLLDARDQLITRLAQKAAITTVNQSDGSINVSIGSGQPLVIGFNAQSLSTGSDAFAGTSLRVGFTGPSGTLNDLSRFISGGELGALLDFREQQIDPARNQLGLVAMGISATFNEQHQLGLDLNGQPGADFFAPHAASVTAHTNNSDLSSANVTITDTTALTGDDYKLQFDSGQWTLTNLSTGAGQTGAGPFAVDGLSVDVLGAPVDGDAFLIQPTNKGAANFAVVLGNPEGFAAASPLRSQEELSNLGSLSIENLAVSDASALPLAGPATLTFNPDALGVGIPGFDVVGVAGGPLAYDPALENNGKTLSLGGFEFTVSGVPEPGDALRIENNSNGTGDNRNALSLGALQASRELGGGTLSYQEAYGSLVADVAIQSRQAETGNAIESVLLEQAQASRDSVSGVNLDEEAANLVRFQQAYQAAAQIISVADELFQTLLAATRR